MTLFGVRVSVRPEIFLAKPNRTGSTSMGATKLYFSKTKPLEKEAGEYIASFVRHYADRIYGQRASIDYRMCQSVDVIGRNIALRLRPTVRSS